MSNRLLRRVEAERLDLSYRLLPKPRKAMIAISEITSLVEVYYNAGRYAAGARDVTAVKADAQLQDLLGKGF